MFWINVDLQPAWTVVEWELTIPWDVFPGRSSCPDSHAQQNRQWTVKKMWLLSGLIKSYRSHKTERDIDRLQLASHFQIKASVNECLLFFKGLQSSPNWQHVLKYEIPYKWCWILPESELKVQNRGSFLWKSIIRPEPLRILRSVLKEELFELDKCVFQSLPKISVSNCFGLLSHLLE